MSPNDKIFIEEILPLHRNKTIMKETLNVYYKAEMILKGASKINQRSCSCNYRELKNTVDSLYDNYIKNNGQTST